MQVGALAIWSNMIKKVLMSKEGIPYEPLHIFKIKQNIQ